MQSDPIPRPTSRVIVLDEDDRVLLIHATDGEFRGSGQPVWITPGGGLEESETFEDAALRELQEEVGLSNIVLGPCVWTRRFPYALNDGVPREKHERYFVCRVTHFEVGDVSRETLDLEAVSGFRWWSVDEIRANRHEVFVPRALGDLLPHLLRSDHPSLPLEVGI